MLPWPSRAAGWKLRALGALLAGGIAAAPGLAVAPAGVAAAVRPRHVFLWEVATSGETSSRLYLLGAMHVGREQILSLDPVIEDAFARSDVLAVEAHVPRSDERAFQQFMLARGTLDDGSTLRERIPEPLHAALQRAVTAQKHVSSTYEPLEPWLVALMLSADDHARAGYRVEFGMESYFLGRVGAHRRIEELEGALRQIEVLDALPRAVQNAMLAETLQRLGRSETRAREIEAIWEAGDAERLAAFLFDRRSGAAQLRLLEHVYFARNRAMAARLEAALRGPGVWFAIVGAGHLVGERGIPALLARAGHRVRQLEASSPTGLEAQLSAD
jgi:uncharacterized protein